MKASVGHIRDLPRSEIGVAAPPYQPRYELTDRAQDVVRRLVPEARRATIYLATDPDREGEAIAWHLKEALGLDEPKRVTFDAITSKVILAAVSAPRKIDDRLVRAQEARRVLDRLVGYRVSPALTEQAGQQLSAGRVQSSAVRRTDSQNLSGEAVELLRRLAAANGWPVPEKPRVWGSKDGTQEAHEAIRPTHFEMRDTGDGAAQQGLYRLIWLRAVACQLADAEYDTTTLDLASSSDPDIFAFRARGAKLRVKGWKVLTEKDATEKESEDEAENARDADGGAVPAFAVGTSCTAESGKVLPKKTRPPERYTQASLIKKLEALGIGRPSTFSSILKTIMDRGFVSEEKRLLAATETGILTWIGCAVDSHSWSTSSRGSSRRGLTTSRTAKPATGTS